MSAALLLHWQELSACVEAFFHYFDFRPRSINRSLMVDVATLSSALCALLLLPSNGHPIFADGFWPRACLVLVRWLFFPMPLVFFAKYVFHCLWRFVLFFVEQRAGLATTNCFAEGVETFLFSGELTGFYLGNDLFYLFDVTGSILA